MERKRPPTYVLVISTLGVILVVLASIAIYQVVRAEPPWPIYYGAVLLIVGAIFLVVSSILTRKYVKPTKQH